MKEEIKDIKEDEEILEDENVEQEEVNDEESKKNDEKTGTKSKIKKRKIIITCFLLFAIILFVVAIYVLNRDSIRLSVLLKKEKIISAKTNAQIESTDYPIESSKYIDVTSSGIIYVYEDNGYPEGDSNRELTYICEKDIETGELTLLKFELTNLEIVSPKDKELENGQIGYVSITLNGNTYTVYEKDFLKVLNEYDMEI